MKILLTDEEIETLEYEILHRYFPSQQFKGIRKSWEYAFLNNIAKAQLKKVVEWLEEYDYGDAPTPTQIINWIKQALLNEVDNKGK